MVLVVMVGRWDSLFDDFDVVWVELENKFVDLGVCVEARCREMAAYFSYGFRVEVECVLE